MDALDREIARVLQEADRRLLPLREFNQCHGQTDGKFCSGGGARSKAYNAGGAPAMGKKERKEWKKLTRAFGMKKSARKDFFLPAPDKAYRKREWM